MPLVKCPDCGKMVSDRAPSCVNCGAPTPSSLLPVPSNVTTIVNEKPKGRIAELVAGGFCVIAAFFTIGAFYTPSPLHLHDYRSGPLLTAQVFLTYFFGDLAFLTTVFIFHLVTITAGVVAFVRSGRKRGRGITIAGALLLILSLIASGRTNPPPAMKQPDSSLRPTAAPVLKKTEIAEARDPTSPPTEVGEKNRGVASDTARIGGSKTSVSSSSNRRVLKEVKGVEPSSTAVDGAGTTTQDNSAFAVELERLVPDYKSINSEPGFFEYLTQRDNATGKTYKDLSLEALQRSSAAEVAWFFSDYQSKKTKPQIRSTPSPPPVASHVGEEPSDPIAQYDLATRIIASSNGRPEYNEEAARWFRKAAELGYANAQVAIGGMYRDGKGVSRDYAEAIKWFRLAGNQGDALGRFLLGEMYEKGAGVPKDLGEAATWYRLAISAGSAEANDALARVVRIQ